MQIDVEKLNLSLEMHRKLHCLAESSRRQNVTSICQKSFMDAEKFQAFHSRRHCKAHERCDPLGPGISQIFAKTSCGRASGENGEKVPQDGISSLPIRARKMPMTSFGQMNFPVFPHHLFAAIITPICIPLLKLFHRRNPAGKHSSINHPDSFHLHGPK